MTLVNESIGGLILLLLAIGVAFEVYRYIKGHPQALVDLKAKVAGLEASASADWAALHSKVDSLITKVDATHAAALAPVTVTVVPATPAAPATPPNPDMTARLFPQGPATQTPPPASAPAPSLGANQGTNFPSTDLSSVALRNYLSPGATSFTIAAQPVNINSCTIGYYVTVGSAAMNIGMTLLNADGAVVAHDSTGGGQILELNWTSDHRPYTMILTVDAAGWTVVEMKQRA